MQLELGRLRPGSQSRKRAARQKRPAACRPGAASLATAAAECQRASSTGLSTPAGSGVHSGRRRFSHPPQPPIASVTSAHDVPASAALRANRTPHPTKRRSSTATRRPDCGGRPAATGFAGNGLHATVQHRRQRAHNRRPKRRARPQRRPTDHTRVPLTVLRHRTARLTHWSPLSRRNASASALRGAHLAAGSGLGLRSWNVSRGRAPLTEPVID